MTPDLLELLNNLDTKKHAEWLTKATDTQVEDYLLAITGNNHYRNLALEERRKRLALKRPEPHWTVTPAFWVSVAAMIFAAIAAWPVIRDWLWPHH